MVDSSMKMRAVAFLLASATSASAAMSPGPPPWSCNPIAACNATDVCVSLMSFPLRFSLARVEGDQTKYDLSGVGGATTSALEMPSLADAKRFIETDETYDRMPYLLVRNELVSDSNGFWLLSSYTRAGKRHMGDDRLLISCNRIRH